MATTVSSPDQPETPDTTPFNATDATTNALRAYRSYSYHFLLIAMDTTAYLDSATDPKIRNILSNSSFYERPVGNPRGIKFDDNHLGRYCIFIDSRQDTDFIIEDVEWGTAFIGNSTSANSAAGLNTFLTDGQMKIIEPRGVNFLNKLSSLAGPDQLDTDPASMPFMLKVIFVGHKDDGTVESSLGKDWDPPPFGVILTDITGAVDANGTTYDIKYCGAVNGTGWNRVYDSIFDTMNFTFTINKSLQQHLTEFERQINDKYMADRQIVIDNYMTATSNRVNLGNTAKIQWKIVLDSGSEKLQYLKDFGKLIPQYKTIAGTSSLQPGTKEGGFTELIDKLMASSQEWNNVQISGDPEVKDFNNVTTRFAYKVSTEFEKSSSLKDNVFTITYHISEYEYTVVDIVDGQSGQGNAAPPKVGKDNAYVFNYIFTGKNVDIIKLDMNLSMGYALWISLVTSKGLPTQTSDVTGTSSDAATIQTRPIQSNLDPRQSIRTGTPIWPTASAIETSRKELIDNATVMAADSIWRNFASYQAIQTELIIHGNPTLIQKITNPSRTGPDYVKINVKMPSTTDDVWEYEQSANPQPGGYYQTFWFDGYYNIITAKNRFIGGQFTQELSLIGIPQVSSDMIASNSIQGDAQANAQTPQTTFSTASAPPPAPPPLQDVTTAGNQNFSASMTPSPFLALPTTPFSQQVSAAPTVYSALDRSISSAELAFKTAPKTQN